MSLTVAMITHVTKTVQKGVSLLLNWYIVVGLAEMELIFFTAAILD